MSPETAWFIIPCLAYLVGSIPFGYLFAKSAAGMDIRRQGSGNIGATNVARVLGAKWGILVLILDLLKGTLAVILLPKLAPQNLQNDLAVWCGFAAVIGHMYPPWLRFKGGKGVATALGVVIPLSPPATLVAVTVFLFVVGSSRIVSLGSVLAVSSFSVAHLARVRSALFAPENRSLTIFCMTIPLMIIIAHRQNLLRLFRGAEPRLGQKKSPPRQV